MPRFRSGPSASYAAALAADAAKKQAARAPTGYVYALVNPLTHLVRYVGQTTDIDKRYRSHCSGKDVGTSDWVRSMRQSPILVILETVEHRTVPCKGSGAGSLNATTIAETKWIKRFRRTILNTRTRENSATTWDWLKNPDES